MPEERPIKQPSLSPAVVGLGLVLALVGLASWFWPTRAGPTATITVNTVADGLINDGNCSLREAIQAANTNAAVDACPAGSGADTITFDAATDGTPIVLTGAAEEDANASGDLDILDGGDLTIQGNGAGSTIVDGGNIDRVFHVCPGGSCANTVTLHGLTIRNGDPGIGFGGGIYNEGATLNVHSSAIGEAGAGNQAWRGGGIHNEAGTTTVDDSTIIANTALTGGGIRNDGGTLVVQNGSTVSANTCTRPDGAGGGILNDNGTVRVDGSSVISNTAGWNGGGGINNHGALTVTNGSVIRDNTADDGGGIYNRATLTVDSSSVISNTGRRYGGGIYNYSSGKATLNGSSVAANTAADNGGGIYNHAGTLTVDSSSVISNTTRGYGGGIYNRGTLNVRNGSSVISNTADSSGGGIVNADTTTVDASSVISNTADNGGGILTGFNCTTTVSSSWILNNTADQYGGGVHNLGTMTVTGSTVSRNMARFGGGIRNQEGMLAVEGSTLSRNIAHDDGGGISNGLRSTATIMVSCILNNTATASGGGVYNYADADEATRVTGSSIVGNSGASFFNDQPAQQIATGNWWGAATGPNTPGADTVDGNVDTSGYLTAPILDCTPDLRVSKANDTGGEATAGTPFHWILTVSNAGLMDAVFSDGQEILIDDLPAGPTYWAPTVADLVNVAGGASIDCSIAGNSLTCEAGGGSVTVGAAGSLAVTFSVTASEEGTLSNPAGICRVDPDGNVAEGDENNDCPTDTVTVVEDTSQSVYLPLGMRNAGAP